GRRRTSPGSSRRTSSSSLEQAEEPAFLAGLGRRLAPEGLFRQLVLGVPLQGAAIHLLRPLDGAGPLVQRAEHGVRVGAGGGELDRLQKILLRLLSEARVARLRRAEQLEVLGLARILIAGVLQRRQRLGQPAVLEVLAAVPVVLPRDLRGVGGAVVVLAG